MYKWETGKYPPWFMARTLVWHKLHNLIESHTQDAISAKLKKKSR